MLKWLDKYQTAVCLTCCVLLAFNLSIAKASSKITYEITDTKASVIDKSLMYTIVGSSVPLYTVSERFSPFRIILDIADAKFAKNKTPSPSQVPINDFAHLKIGELVNHTPPVIRFEFVLADSHDYSVEKNGFNLVIKFFPAKAGKKQAISHSNKLSLTDFLVSSSPNSTTITITSNTPIKNYTVDTIGGDATKPPRMYIDITDVAINELIREKHIGTSVDQVRVAPRGKGARIVFDSAHKDLFSYSVAPTQQGLSIVIDESKFLSTVQSENKMTSSTTDKTLDALIDSSEELLSQDPAQLEASASVTKTVQNLDDDFSFSGYKKQRISIDFYKIDIHNVFRLFRQITDLNVIVDEAVSGSLTLALTDVPWDFALDIILNLMDLKKEERFNTIVIYPAKKEFLWPTRAEDNIDIKADIEIIQQEALLIEKSSTQPKEIKLAKEFMIKAQTLEAKEEYEDAASMFSKALKQWPTNSKISNRLASLYLVNLGMNAKAVYYAKESLKQNPKNTHAALYAAIGSANMQRISEASEYFTQSISQTPPMKEALISFAAFSENNGKNDAALKLLEKYNQYYQETADTMLSKARILDKIGLTKEATQQYEAFLASGFQIRPDLKKYISGRIAARDLM